MKTCLISALLAFCLAPTVVFAEVSDEEWAKAEAEFKAKWAKRSSRVEAVEGLARVEDVRAVQQLWTILTTMRPSAEIRQVILDALSECTDEAAIRWLASRVEGKMSASKRLRVLEALRHVQNDEVARAIAVLITDDSAAIRTAAIHAVGMLEYKAAAPKVIAALSDEMWQVRASAIECCVRLMVKSTILPLIERLGLERGRLEGDIVKALRSMTGENMDTALAWKAWWNNKGRKSELAGDGISDWQDRRTNTTRNNSDKDSAGSVATYYGIKIYSLRLIFVIDMSGSMDKPYQGKRPKQRKITVTLTGGSDDEEPRKATLDWGKIKTKWDLAREQLIFTLLQLSPKTEFSIVYYNDKVRVWKKKLVLASKDNVDAAIAMLRKIDPNDSTNIHGALMKAFQIGGNTRSSKVELTGGGAYKKGGDTIFFMTDGWPTSGKVIGIRIDTEEVVKGWLEKMMRELEGWNTTRRLKIHCIGVGKDHCKKLMRAISSKYGGDYIIAGND